LFYSISIKKYKETVANIIFNKFLASYFNRLYESFCSSEETDFLKHREYLPAESKKRYKIHFVSWIGDEVERYEGKETNKDI
jgi:hypothetical protein